MLWLTLEWIKPTTVLHQTENRAPLMGAKTEKKEMNTMKTLIIILSLCIACPAVAETMSEACPKKNQETWKVLEIREKCEAKFIEIQRDRQANPEKYIEEAERRAQQAESYAASAENRARQAESDADDAERRTRRR